MRAIATRHVCDTLTQEIQFTVSDTSGLLELLAELHELNLERL
jgi:hypothetical protein